jgi:hypothetical protein
MINKRSKNKYNFKIKEIKNSMKNKFRSLKKNLSKTKNKYAGY